MREESGAQSLIGIAPMVFTASSLPPRWANRQKHTESNSKGNTYRCMMVDLADDYDSSRINGARMVLLFPDLVVRRIVMTPLEYADKFTTRLKTRVDLATEPGDTCVSN